MSNKIAEAISEANKFVEPGMTPVLCRLAQVNYESYCKSRDWKSYDGQSLPPWTSVQGFIQKAWVEGVLGVLRELESQDEKKLEEPRSFTEGQ